MVVVVVVSPVLDVVVFVAEPLELLFITMLFFGALDGFVDFRLERLSTT